MGNVCHKEEITRKELEENKKEMKFILLTESKTRSDLP